jgi:hypothetical protein
MHLTLSVKAAQKKLGPLMNVYGKHSHIVMMKYDIENFFTNVHIGVLHDALNFFFLFSQTIYRILNGFWINKTNVKIVMIKAPKLMNEFYYLNVDQIIKVIIHDMSNAYFRLGVRDQIMRQTAGLSIGGHLSSALAIMLANYGEHMALSSIYSSNFFSVFDKLIIEGVRIVDDGLLFFANDKLNCNWEIEFGFVLELFLKWFGHFTGNTLNLVFDKLSSSYEFLENKLFLDDNCLKISCNIKNFESLVKNGQQKYVKGIHKYLIISSRIKMHTIFTSFLRIDRGCSEHELIIISALKFIYVVLCAYKWPKHWIKEAVSIMSSRNSTNIMFRTAWIYILNNISFFYLYDSGLLIDHIHHRYSAHNIPLDI